MSATARVLVTESGPFLSDAAILANAENTLIDQCMTTHGFDYYYETATVTSDADRLVVGSMADRLKNGYGLYSEFTRVDTSTGGTTQTVVDGAPADGTDTSPTGLYLQALGPVRAAAYQEALLGTPKDLVSLQLPVGGKGLTIQYPGRGCTANARRELYGSLDSWAAVMNVFQYYYVQMGPSVYSSMQYHNVMSRWASCMADSGYHYALPSDAEGYLSQQYETEGPTPALQALEIRTAVTDLQCADSVGVTKTVVAIEMGLANQFPSSEVEEMNHVAALDSAALSKATSVLHAQHS